MHELSSQIVRLQTDLQEKHLAKLKSASHTHNPNCGVASNASCSDRTLSPAAGKDVQLGYHSPKRQLSEGYMHPYTSSFQTAGLSSFRLTLQPERVTPDKTVSQPSSLYSNSNRLPALENMPERESQLYMMHPAQEYAGISSKEGARAGRGERRGRQQSLSSLAGQSGEVAGLTSAEILEAKLRGDMGGKLLRVQKKCQ